MSALLYDRSNPAAAGPDAYASGVRQGGLYAIALAPDAVTPVGATVEFPYRVVADLGRVRYYALDASAARDADEAAFMRAYAAEPGVTNRFVANAYTLAIEARTGPGGTVRLVARPHPAGASADGRFYISASTDVDTVRRIGAATEPADLIAPTTTTTTTTITTVPPSATAAPAATMVPAVAPDLAGTAPGQAARALTLDQLREADRIAEAQRMPAWIREPQTSRGRGHVTGGRGDVGSVGGVRTARDESQAEPPQGPEALAIYKRQRARQLARTVPWVQSQQQRQAQLAVEALDEARARASERARVQAQAEVEAMAGGSAAVPPTRLAARVRHRQAEIAQSLVDQPTVDAIQREAAARARADIEAAITQEVEREIGAGLFYAVPRGGARTRSSARPAAAPVSQNIPPDSATLSGGTRGGVASGGGTGTTASRSRPPQIDVQPQPATTTPGATRVSGPRNRRHSNAAVRAAAMSVFQDTVAQRLAHLPDDSPVIRDIIAEWSTATRSNPAGLTGAMARERAVQWWASQRWADAEPAERARHAEEAKARADSDAVAMAEAAVRRRLQEAALSVEPAATMAAAAARSRRRRADQRDDETQLDEPEQARREAERMAAAPPTKRARRAPMPATGPPPLAVRTATGQLVEAPRPALAAVPVPVAVRNVPTTMATTATSAGPSTQAVPLGVSRSSVPGGGFLGRVPLAPSPIEAAMASTRAGTSSTPSAPSSVGDVAARLRQLGLAQAQRAAVLQRQTGLQWAQGL